MKRIILLSITSLALSCEQSEIVKKENVTKSDVCDCEPKTNIYVKSDKIVICHKGTTKSINIDSWAEHEAHGDFIGECNSTLSVEDVCKDYCN